MAAMIIKEEKAIRLNCPTSCMFVEDLCQPLIPELIVRLAILAKANNSVGWDTSSIPSRLVDLTLKDDGRWQRPARGVDSLDDGNPIAIP
jgi:hypothetical protein